MIARLFRNNNPQPALSLRSSFIGRLRPFIARSAFILGGLLPAVGMAQAPDLTVCAGKGYTLTSNVNASGASEVTYQWYESVDGAAAVPVDNSNTPSYSFAAGKTTAGTYAYVRKAVNDDCTDGVFSNTYTVVVAAPVIASVSGSTVCANATTVLTATVSSGTTAVMTYTWIVGSTSSTTSVNTKTTTTLNANTAFTVTVTNADGCTSVPYSGTITITSGASNGSAPNACGCANGYNECTSLCAATSLSCPCGTQGEGTYIGVYVYDYDCRSACRGQLWTCGYWCGGKSGAWRCCCK